jgi:acetyl-CoA/propionyl-CoA carboxylase biotin carboxyl carrier protein
VTGRDLVADQLRIAAGEPLGFDQAAADRSSGHAVEVRLYAEDAEDGFLPATGRIEMLGWPDGEGIRVDAGVEAGDVVGGRFDPMLAKIVAWGPDRPSALDRLATALDETLVLGLVTNLRFLRWLVRQPIVRTGQARTDALDRIWPPDDWAERVTVPDAAWRTAARMLVRTGDPADPWSGAWRLNAAPSVALEVEGTRRTIGLADPEDDAPDAGGAFEAVLAGGVAYIDIGGRSVAFRVATPPDVDASARSASAHLAAGTGPAELVAPMPGAVLRVHAAVDAIVAAGDPVITLEAMKMEHVVSAPFAGRLAEVLVRPADQVARGQLLAVVEP